MRALLLILSFSLTTSALAISVDDCLKDAESHGNHIAPIIPNPDCVAAIEASPAKISVEASDGSFKVYGQDHMIYVDKYESGSLISRKLLAGDQTELSSVKSMTINLLKKRLVIVQQGNDGAEVLTYNLEFIGNVSPITMLKSEIAQYASKAELKDDENEIAITFSSLSKIRYYSSEADSRYKDEQPKFVPTLLRESAIP